MSLSENLNKKELVNWIPPIYNRVRRDENTYRATNELLSLELERLVGSYQELETHKNSGEQQEVLQSLRLIRDLIDFVLRRYHGYAIRQRIGAHYSEAELDGEDSIYEHLIPASILRDLLLGGVLSIQHVLDSPTVLLSKENDRKLREKGLVSANRDLWFPFRRYELAGIKGRIISVEGSPINLNNWTLKDHYRLVDKIKLNFV